MGYKVSGSTITLTRGDTLRVKVDIWEDDEKTIPYEIQSGDSVRFAVKKAIFVGGQYQELEDHDPLINKQVPTDTLILELQPNDTKSLPFGTYLYDLELTKANGDVDTFIMNAKFKLTTEVH